MSQLFDCVVAGHICLDIAPHIGRGGKTVADVFRPGKLIEVGSATISTGGVVSNTGLPLRRLGSTVKLMGKCGDDILGRAILEALRREAPGAEDGMQVVAGEETSYSVVLNIPGVDRMFLHCPGCNDTFTADDIDLSVVASARMFHFGYPPLMAAMYADDGREILHMFHQAKQAGATTSLDMALPDPSGPSGKVHWASILKNILPDVDLFTPSVEELTFMLRPDVFADLTARANGGDMLSLVSGELLADLADQCLQAGAGAVLIKCGYQGMYVRTADRDRLEAFGRAKPGNPTNWANRELFAPSYKASQLVSATGAGDCAIAGFLSAFLRGFDIAETVRCACAVGAQNVTQADSISGVLGWDETIASVTADLPQNEVTISLPGFSRCEAMALLTGAGDSGEDKD